MKRLSLLFLTVLITLLCGNCAKASYRDDSYIFNRTGINYLKNGNIKAAIKSFEKACKINPFNDEALSNLACAHNNWGVKLAKKHKYNLAIRQFKIAESQKPESIDIKLNLLSLYVILKQTQKAFNESEKILQLRPDDPEILLKTAIAYKQLEYDNEAETLLIKAIELAPDNFYAHMALAKLLYKQNNLNEALYNAKRACEINSENKNAEEFYNKLKAEQNLLKNSSNYTSVHFILTCPDFITETQAENILNELEEAYELVGDKLNYYPLERAQTIALANNNFKCLKNLPRWAGGIYDGKIRLPVNKNINMKKLAKTIVHEYTHHVIYLLAEGKCPIWLNEGIAQLMERQITNEDEAADYTAYLPTNEKEINLCFSKIKDKEKVKALYLKSLALTQNIVKQFGWPILNEILICLAQNYNFKQAIIKTTNLNYSRISSIIYKRKEL